MKGTPNAGDLAIKGVAESFSTMMSHYWYVPLAIIAVSATYKLYHHRRRSRPIRW